MYDVLRKQLRYYRVLQEDMAKDLNYSPSYLRHTFKKKSGKNIGEALNDVRLFQAKQLLLKNGFQPLSEIEDWNLSENGKYFFGNY